MWRGYPFGFKYWGKVIIGIILFALLLSCSSVTKTMKPIFLKNANAQEWHYTPYFEQNQEAYDLIQKEKMQFMLSSVIKAYQREHQPKIQPKPLQKDKQNTNVEKEASPPPPPKPNSSDGNGVVYLTIDDGPSSATATIIKLLNQYHATATFFMLEPRMREYPAILKTLAKNGFGLGLHGVTHDKNKFYQSTNTVVGEMKTAQTTLQKITGIKTNLIRVPYGSVPYMTKTYREAEVQAGFIMWDWNIDSRDWDYRDQRYVTSAIQQLQRINARNERAVILIHDRPETAKYLPQLLDYLIKHHYKLRKIDASVPPLQFRSRS